MGRRKTWSIFSYVVLLPHPRDSGFHTPCRDGPEFQGLGERRLNPRIFQLSHGISLERGISTLRLLSFALATRSKLWGQNETNEGSQQEGGTGGSFLQTRKEASFAQGSCG